MVAARDEFTGAINWRPVTELYRRGAQGITHVTLEGLSGMEGRHAMNRAARSRCGRLCGVSQLIRSRTTFVFTGGSDRARICENTPMLQRNLSGSAPPNK